MFPGGRMNPRQMKAMMKRMGVSTEEIEDIEEIVIRTKSKDMVFRDVTVTVMIVQGQKTYQIVGEPEIQERETEDGKMISGDDVALVMEQTGTTEDEAKRALEECDGQPAEAILKLLSSR